MVISDVTWAVVPGYAWTRGLSLGRGFWGRVDMVVFPWTVVPGDAWTRWSFLGLWFLGKRGRGGLSLGRGFWRCVDVVVFSLGWFLKVRGCGAWLVPVLGLWEWFLRDYPIGDVEVLDLCKVGRLSYWVSSGRRKWMCRDRSLSRLQASLTGFISKSTVFVSLLGRGSVQREVFSKKLLNT